MKIFLTGATGLLGRFLASELAALGEVAAMSHGKGGNGLNVEDPESVRAAIENGGYTHVVHPAAVRTPEDCLADPAKAYMVNVVAVEYIARSCRSIGAKFVYVSTDYVFSGTRPLYRETDAPEPLNVYGRTKLAGEFIARSLPGHLITRVPALWLDDPQEWRAPMKAFVEKLKAGKPFKVDNVLRRRYTLAPDAAKGIAHLVGRDASGIVHISARESQTKADFARAVARSGGFDESLIVNADPPSGADARPYDSGMDTSLYEFLGGPRIRNLSEVLP